MEESPKLLAQPKQELKFDGNTLPEGDLPAITTDVEHGKPDLHMLPDVTYIKDAPAEDGVKQSSFLQRTSFLLELTRNKQSKLLFFICQVFVGLIVFTRICTPLFTPSDKLEFSYSNLPQLEGEWVVNDVTDVPAAPHNLRFTVAQKSAELNAKGSDEFGEFELVGKLIPPNKIHLEKIHNNSQLHDTQIMDGELTLENEPLYAHGIWTRAHAIDGSKESLQAEGYWDANFYTTKPQPQFTQEYAFRSPRAIMEYFLHGPVSSANQEEQ